MAELPDLGVGIVYLPGLESFIEAGNDLIDVVEIEPQPFWFKTLDSRTPYRVDTAALERIISFPQPKLVHGVGSPLGGRVSCDDEQLAPFIETILSLKAPWASEHLAFSRIEATEGTLNTGFFLPPLQTRETVLLVAENIRKLSADVPVPVAFETGVNYLKPIEGEMSDGSFFGEIAETANCGIVLDLHNLWCNELNGRQPILEALKQIPLERVWEVHLAGGDNMDGYRLDAHSGLVPPGLMDLASRIIPCLPNLRAIIFELIPDYMRPRGLEPSDLTSQLLALHYLWRNRRKKCQVSIKYTHKIAADTCLSHPMPTPEEWESTLGSLVLSRPPKHVDSTDVASDKGINIYRNLVASVRTGTIVATLTLTYRLIVLSVGEQKFLEMLEEFWEGNSPDPFAAQEAIHFASFLESRAFAIPYLYDVLSYELESHNVLIRGEARTVPFFCEPFRLLAALSEGHLPESVPAGKFILTITP